MANVAQTNFSHTYNGAEIIREVFFEPEEDNPALESLYRIVDARDKTNIYLPQKLRKIFRVDSNGCGFSAAGGTFNINDKTISTEKIKANLELCVEEFIDTVWSETLKRGVDINDLSGTDIDTMVREQVVKATRSDLHRLAWFASDATSSGADWNAFDGWIQLFIDNSAAINTDSTFFDLSTQGFEDSSGIVADGAQNAFEKLYEEAGAELLAMPNKVFYVSRGIKDNYLKSLEDQNNSVGQSNLENGVSNITYRGIPVVEVPEWQVNLDDTTNPQNSVVGSHLIVFTTPDNLVIGTDTVSAGGTMNQFKFRYNDDDDEKLKIIAKMKLGAQYVHESLVGVAI